MDSWLKSVGLVKGQCLLSTLLHSSDELGALSQYLCCDVITRDHSFPRHTEFWSEPRNLPISAEFLCFRWILRNLVLASDKARNMAYFGRFQIINYYPYMSRRHDCAVKYATATRALTGYWTEFIWNIVSLFGKQTYICQLQLPATSTAYLVGFRGP